MYKFTEHKYYFHALSNLIFLELQGSLLLSPFYEKKIQGSEGLSQVTDRPVTKAN